MTTISSPTNTASQSVDSVVLSTGTGGLLKKGVTGSNVTPSGGDTAAVAQEVGTHIDDGAFAIGTSTVSAVGFLADDTSPDSVDEGDIGTPRMGLDRVMYTREVGPSGTRVTHAISVGTAATSIGTAFSSGRKSIDVYNGGTVSIYLGPSTVGTATGIPLGTASYYYEEGGVALYAITASGTAALRVQERS